jgi:triosephosphate isomerase
MGCKATISTVNLVSFIGRQQSMRQMMVAGNWKMHGSVAFTSDMVTTLASKVVIKENVTLLVCPPAVYLAQAAAAAAHSGVHVGAQNLASVASPGAYTGEVAGFMLADIGCQYVIVGHSERRALYAEDNEIVAHKAKVALDAGLVPLVCVGETLEQREAGKAQEIITAQLDAVSAVIGVDGWSQAIVAYEPVWAIGTGRTASPEQAQEIHAVIRARLAELDAGMATAMRILYGGSVKPDNAESIFSQLDVDGGLIGGASLNADDFARIYACAQTK